MQKNVIVLLFHGSRVVSANKEAERLCDKIQRALYNFSVYFAFLQFHAPYLFDILEKAAKNGARDVTVFPLFILSGKHIQSDLPQIIQDFCSKYPAIKVRILEHLGADSSFIEWIINKLKGNNVTEY